MRYLCRLIAFALTLASAPAAVQDAEVRSILAVLEELHHQAALFNRLAMVHLEKQAEMSPKDIDKQTRFVRALEVSYQGAESDKYESERLKALVQSHKDKLQSLERVRQLAADEAARLQDASAQTQRSAAEIRDLMARLEGKSTGKPTPTLAEVEQFAASVLRLAKRLQWIEALGAMADLERHKATLTGDLGDASYAASVYRQQLAELPVGDVDAREFAEKSLGLIGQESGHRQGLIDQNRITYEAQQKELAALAAREKLETESAAKPQDPASARELNWERSTLQLYLDLMSAQAMEQQLREIRRERNAMEQGVELLTAIREERQRDNSWVPHSGLKPFVRTEVMDPPLDVRLEELAERKKQLDTAVEPALRARISETRKKLANSRP
jgi:hypothetical protein